MNADRNQSQPTCFDFVIVGAGISGLIVARELMTLGYRIKIVEKSKSVGGRMATRRDELRRFDHGAQFINLNDPELAALDQHLTQNAVIQPWFRRGGDWVKTAELGINQIPKFLSKDIEIVFSEKVLKIETDLDLNLKVLCESGHFYFAKKVILSCPVPQSRALLENSKENFPDELNLIDYASCVVGLFGLQSNSSEVLNFSYLENVNSDVFSISNQTHKKVSLPLALTITMTPEWSQQHFEKSDVELEVLVRTHLEDFLKTQKIEFQVASRQIKKWKLSHPLKKCPHSFLSLGRRFNIFLIGDAFGGPSAAGAMKSALALSQHLQGQKNKTASL